jgi:hypothetical protein
MSDTPRTDKACTARMSGYMTGCVDANFARELERELNAAHNEIARRNGQTNYACVCGGTALEAQQRDEWKACAEELARALKIWGSDTDRALGAFNTLKSK